MKTIEKIMEEEFCDTMFTKLEEHEIKFVKDAMEVFAKQEAIAFAELVGCNYKLQEKGIWRPIGEYDPKVTTEQLYQLFKQQV